MPPRKPLRPQTHNFQWNNSLFKGSYLRLLDAPLCSKVSRRHPFTVPRQATGALVFVPSRRDRAIGFDGRMGSRVKELVTPQPDMPEAIRSTDDGVASIVREHNALLF